MEKELPIAIAAGLGGMLGWGLADFFAKKTIDQIGDIVSLVWAHVIGVVAFILIAVGYALIASRPIALPTSGSTWLLLALFGAGQAAVYLLVYRGFGKGQLALLNPVFSSFSGLTALLSIVAFGEAATVFRVGALVIIFAGILLVSLDLHALRSKRIHFANIPGLKEIGLATLLAAFWTLGWDQFVSDNDWVLYSLLMYVFMTVVIIVVAMLQRVPLAVRKPDAWKFLALIGLCEAIAYLAISLGYSATTLTSVVVLLSGAFSLPTILLARVFLKERTTVAQAIGSGVIVLGIILLALR